MRAHHGLSFKAGRSKLCMQPLLMRALVLGRSKPTSAASEAVSWFALFPVSKNHRRRHFSRLCRESKVAQRPRFRGTGWPQIRPPRPSEAEVLPEGLDVFLGVLGGHLNGVCRGVWRAKRAAGGGASERSELTAGGLAVAAEGSGLRVSYKCSSSNYLFRQQSSIDMNVKDTCGWTPSIFSPLYCKCEEMESIHICLYHSNQYIIQNIRYLCISKIIMIEYRLTFQRRIRKHALGSLGYLYFPITRGQFLMLS